MIILVYASIAILEIFFLYIIYKLYLCVEWAGIVLSSLYH